MNSFQYLGIKKLNTNKQGLFWKIINIFLFFK